MKISLAISSLLLATLSSPAFAGWHHLDKVVKVTVSGDTFFVQGANVGGDTSCVNESGFYGTLTHSSSQPGHKEYYGMAIVAQTLEKGMACYVGGKDSHGVCVMENCYTY